MVESGTPGTNMLLVLMCVMMKILEYSSGTLVDIQAPPQEIMSRRKTRKRRKRPRKRGRSPESVSVAFSGDKGKVGGLFGLYYLFCVFKLSSLELSCTCVFDYKLSYFDPDLYIKIKENQALLSLVCKRKWFPFKTSELLPNLTFYAYNQLGSVLQVRCKPVQCILSYH